MTESTKDSRKNLKTRTKLVYAGRHPAQQHGFVNTPVYRGSTVLFPTYQDLITRNAHFSYGTQGSPTTEALTEAWTEFSGAAGTVLAPTGLAAITLALLTAVKAGDHILVTDSIYRPSRIFCDTILARMGVETTYFDPLIGAGDRGPDPAQHQRRLPRDARLAKLRAAGRSGHRRDRARQRRLRHPRQHLGDAAVFPAA